VSSASTYLRLRRALDVLAAAALLVLTLPLSAGVAIAVRVSMGSPILFKQERVGQGGRRFAIFKFRTMVQDAEMLGGGYMPAKLDLVPPLGRFLRKTSLDEIPQLINIFRGDMSFIGPRPALPDQVQRYNETQARRLSVPQGLTGLAQVRYRNNATWSVRIESDLDYVERLGPRLDLTILGLTARRVLGGHGVLLDQQPDEVDDLGKNGMDNART